MRVVIVGAGIMGCATALELSERGVDVVLLERAVPGAEASSAAAGILGAQAESHEPSPTFLRRVQAREGYRALADRFAELARVDIGYKKSGVLKLAYTEAELDELREIVRWQDAQGASAEIVPLVDIARIEPEASPHAVGAAYFVDDAQVEPVKVLSALRVLLDGSSRVTILSGRLVTDLASTGGVCKGVSLQGEIVSADAVVLAAGSWSSLVPGAPEAAQRVTPVRGQMLELHEALPTVRTILFGQGAYVVPRGDGRVVCGSTMERVGFQKHVTTEGLASLLTGAMRNAPVLAEASFTRAWANFRPFVEGQPLVGKSSVAGLYLATGHFRNGILLAFETAKSVADAITMPS